MSDLALPLIAHPSADVLSTFVAIYCNGSIKGQKMWRHAGYAARSRFLMVRSPLGFYSVNKCCVVVYPTGRLYINHCPLGIMKNPPIPSSDTYVATLSSESGTRVAMAAGISEE